jgi:hypothetical protein
MMRDIMVIKIRRLGIYELMSKKSLQII